jgi:hypothetical protein
MNTIINSTGPAKPWFKEFWPWFLIAGPAIVVVAAMYTAWLAISSTDGLVSEDYYKEGLKAGETIAQSDHARAQAIVANVLLREGTIKVRLDGRVASGFVLPPTLKVTLSHPTRAGVDQSQSLLRVGQEYSGALNLPRSGHWLVIIEDDAKSWRLMGSLQLPSSGEMVIGGEAPADIRSN